MKTKTYEFLIKKGKVTVLTGRTNNSKKDLQATLMRGWKIVKFKEIKYE